MKLSAGINVGSHDSSLTILNFEHSESGDATIYETERYTKKKQDGYFPILPLKKALIEFPEIKNLSDKNIGITSMGIAAPAMENLLNQAVNHLSLIKLLSLPQFSSMLNENISTYSHHLCHAYAALFCSPFKKSIILIADGCGSSGKAYLSSEIDNLNLLFSPPDDKSFESLSVYLQDNEKLTLIKKIWIDESTLINGPGAAYTISSKYIFGTWKEAGKVMGLAAFGHKTNLKSSKKEFIIDQTKINPNTYLGKDNFNNQPQESFQRLANLALVTQEFFEEEMLKYIKEIKDLYPEYNNLIFSGGCALNCLTNTKLVNLKWFDQVFIPPCPNDEGISLGAAYKKALDIKLIQFRPKALNEMTAFLGSRSILNDLDDDSKMFEKFKDFKISKHQNIIQVASELLKDKNIIAWFQGRSEVGPRALGNRSILCLTNIKGIKVYLNDTIKKREAFRPYGCSIILEKAHEYFECPKNYQMPYMSFAPQVKTEKKEILSEIVHPDGSCRIQTVTKEQNTKYYELLKSVEQFTGHPLLLNTSLNIMGQPILETVDDAVLFLQSTEIKFLIIGDYLVQKP